MARKSNRRGGKQNSKSMQLAPTNKAMNAGYSNDSVLNGPGKPPTPSQLFGREPRTWSYSPGQNLYASPRSGQANSFATLRDLSRSYDAIQMCMQVWFDVIHGLEPHVELEANFLDDGEDSSAYDAQAQEYLAMLNKPDRTRNVLDWMCKAVRDRLECGAMAFYPRLTRGGGFYAIESIDIATLKPLIDVYGRTPEPPIPAFEQYVQGVPSNTFTTDDILYFPENETNDSLYPISRVEMFIMRVNQALRKQSRDMARFTDGNLPAGLIELPESLGQQWTPKDLADFREQWDAMYAGNDRSRSKARVGMYGTKYNQITEDPITTEFDKFLLNIACACMGVTMSDLSFTETVNRATAEAQLAITYMRTVRQVVRVFENILTWVLQNVIGDKRFVYKFKGYEQEDTLATNASAHVALVGAGIESPSDAAKAMKIPSTVDLPRMVITATGPVILDNFAEKAVQAQQLDTLVNPPQPPPTQPQEDSTDATESDDTPDKSEQSSKDTPNAKKPVQRAIDDALWQHTDAEIAKKMLGMHASGVVSQTWKSNPDACDSCIDNNGQTVKLGQPFKNGALTTPSHDHCECITVLNTEEVK